MKTSIEKWREVDGDNTLALDWNLNEDSHVWEIGGFEGRWAKQIWDKFHCNITIFEPQVWAVDRMMHRFGGIEKIDIRPYGLWFEDGKRVIGNYETDGASIIPERFGGPYGEGEFKNFYREIFGFENRIDLALMNIEGSEYYLLPAFVSSIVIRKFENIWVQFHPKDENDKRHEDIFNLLENSGFEKMWDFFPTAVAWRKK